MGNYQRFEYLDEDVGYVLFWFEDFCWRDFINNICKGEFLDEDNCNFSWDNYFFVKIVIIRKFKNLKELCDFLKSL